MRRKRPSSDHGDSYPTFHPSDWPGDTVAEKYLAWRRARRAHLETHGVPYSSAVFLADCYRQRRAYLYPEESSP